MEGQPSSLSLFVVSATFLTIEKLLVLTPEFQLLALLITILSGTVALILNIPKLIKLIKSWRK
jgi:hypothetical protein